LLDNFLDFLGRAICHQLEERSLVVSGEALVVCARDTGIYIGIFSTLIYLHFFKREKNMTIPSIKISFLLLLFLVPLIIDGLGSYLNVFESTNVRRLVTGTLFGFVLPYFIYPLLSKKALDHSSKPVLTTSKDLYIPMLLNCFLGGLFYWGKLSSDLLNGMIILTIIVWFSLCASFLLGSIRRRPIKVALSLFASLAFLSFLSLMHSWILTYAL
jgi:uncharacterized membrane protein